MRDIRRAYIFRGKMVTPLSPMHTGDYPTKPQTAPMWELEYTSWAYRSLPIKVSAYQQDGCTDLYVESVWFKAYFTSQESVSQEECEQSMKIEMQTKTITKKVGEEATLIKKTEHVRGRDVTKSYTRIKVEVEIKTLSLWRKAYREGKLDQTGQWLSDWTYITSLRQTPLQMPLKAVLATFFKKMAMEHFSQGEGMDEADKRQMWSVNLG